MDATADGFYGPEQARIHHERFGLLAEDAATVLAGLLATCGLTKGTVTDLGSGSGILARVLTDRGYDVHGLELSPAMIAIAEQTAPKATFTQGSLVDARIGESVAVTAIGEALNYVTDPRAGLDTVTQLSQRVFDALVPSGVFLFDVSTPGRNLGLELRERIHDHGDWVLTMQATEQGDRLERRIAIFTRGDDGRYTRVDEHHVLHLFDPDELRSVLEQVGFRVETRQTYGADRSDATPPAGWTVFVASKPR
jgi:methylase of polypeptide subunit release factors